VVVAQVGGEKNDDGWVVGVRNQNRKLPIDETAPNLVHVQKGNAQSVGECGKNLTIRVRRMVKSQNHKNHTKIEDNNKI
jgi:hypothetical protein